MNHTAVPAKLRRDAGRLEPAGIRLSFVAKDVKLGRDQEREGKAAQVGSPGWRSMGVPAILGLLDVVFPLPGHLGAGQEDTIGIVDIRSNSTGFSGWYMSVAVPRRQARLARECALVNTTVLGRSSWLAVRVGRNRAHKPEAHAKGVRKCISLNALRLRFRLVASCKRLPRHRLHPRRRSIWRWRIK